MIIDTIFNNYTTITGTDFFFAVAGILLLWEFICVIFDRFF